MAATKATQSHPIVQASRRPVYSHPRFLDSVWILPLPAATGFKRLGLVIGAAVVLGLGAVALSSFLISAESAREAVRAQIKAVTGLDPGVRGPVTISMFPPDTVSLADVSLADDHGEPALTADMLTAHLRLLPLLIGRMEIADLSLLRPKIALTVDPANGRLNWAALLDRLARALKPDAERSDRVSFSEIHINQGTIAIADAGRHISENLEDVELSLAWPSISKSFAATGQFTWRDVPVEASVGIGNFYAALVGESSGLKFRLSGAPLKVAFDGTMSNRPSLKIEGTVAADGTSLRDVWRWIDRRPPPESGLGRFALKAEANAVAGTVTLSGVNLELDGNTAEGVLTYVGEGRNAVQGTLAAETLDLTPYVSALKVMAVNERDWSRRPLSFEGLHGIDLDVRLSAARVTLGNAKLGRTAAAANLHEGRLAVTIGESQAFGGVITGSLAMAAAPSGVTIKSQMQFADVDLERALRELVGLRHVEGKGTFRFAIEGSGGSVDAIAGALAGNATLTATDGALTGINVEQLLRRLQRRPLSGAGDFRNGRTPYERFDLSLQIVQGVATIEEVRLDGSAVRLSVLGTASIPRRDVDLTGTASLLASAGEPAGSFDLPFMVQGSWDEPIILPDPQSLIRRSGAAAPLLDAVRERKARDAVRSAIDRLTGSIRSGPAPSDRTGAPPPPSRGD